jgi:G:T-mismatch repair DNA endonuclease (very short patch repair protein)
MVLVVWECALEYQSHTSEHDHQQLKTIQLKDFLRDYHDCRLVYMVS